MVNGWDFIPKVDVSDGMYLAVFRARTGSAGNATSYTLVGFTAIFNYRGRRDQWNNYQVPESKRFNVQAGDVLGMFYENWDITDAFSVIALADKYSPDYDLLKDLTLLAHVQQRGREGVIYDMNYQGYIDTSLSVRSFRYPAMRVFIDPNGRVLPQTSPQTPNIDPNAGTTRFRLPTTTVRGGTSPACLAEFQTSQSCLDNALREGSPSRRFQARWFFDVTVRMCAMFWYVPDCYRSENLFETEFQCRQTCFGYMVTTPPPEI